MTYDHYCNAGNKGDVWKHVILLSAVRNVLRAKRSPDPFFYCETHAGRHSYTLQERGGWQSGIGSINCIHGALMHHPYFCIQGTGTESGSIYHGSWSLVAEYLRSQEISFEFILCDLSPQVRDNIVKHTLQRPEEETIDFRLADGFSEVHKVPNRPDIIFIDPPYYPEPEHDWISCQNVIGYLQSRHFPFLVWYPIFDDAQPQSLVNLAGSPGYELIWDVSEDNSTRTMRGTGMLIVNIDMIDETTTTDLTDLAQQLGGRFWLRNA
ncbi:MAG: 23S rRNA (adenine(2030)-N(6))-methyltransferase RlmJ [Deltaproteobacteria bacterium]|nr:23S rRNA (adenine(2030)-N(6))-methyltransferase RlmJ [Deltaproteobacteria bacterium]